MKTTHLRKVGGSLMVALPRPLLGQLQIGEGSQVGVYVEGDHLVLKPQQKPSYTLDELLSQCDTSAKKTPEDRDWPNNASIGKEVL